MTYYFDDKFETEVTKAMEDAIWESYVEYQQRLWEENTENEVEEITEELAEATEKYERLKANYKGGGMITTYAMVSAAEDEKYELENQLAGYEWCYDCINENGFESYREDELEHYENEAIEQVAYEARLKAASLKAA